MTYEEAREYLIPIAANCVLPQYAAALEKAMEALEKVEGIVRCKECKHARKSEDAFDWDGETPLCVCGYSKMVNRWHEYCSWGARRAEDAAN